MLAVKSEHTSIFLIVITATPIVLIFSTSSDLEILSLVTLGNKHTEDSANYFTVNMSAPAFSLPKEPILFPHSLVLYKNIIRWLPKYWSPSIFSQVFLPYQAAMLDKKKRQEGGRQHLTGLLFPRAEQRLIVSEKNQRYFIRSVVIIMIILFNLDNWTRTFPEMPPNISKIISSMCTQLRWLRLQLERKIIRVVRAKAQASIPSGMFAGLLSMHAQYLLQY